MSRNSDLPNAESLRRQITSARDAGSSQLDEVSPDAAKPDEYEVLDQPGLPQLHTQEAESLVRLQPHAAPVPLNAYLASALTGLGDEQMALVKDLSRQVDEVCLSLNISLYQPADVTHPIEHADVLDATVYDTDRNEVVTSDLLIHLTHFPSTGAGEELDIAFNAMVPIVLIHKADSEVSRMVTGIPGLVLRVPYTDDDDLRRELRRVLEQLVPQLLQRKLAFSDYSVNLVGDRIRTLRQRQGLTREDLVAASGDRYQLTVDMIRMLEESEDRKSNPSLIQLRELATLLKVSVSELVEPDFESLLLSKVSNMLLGQATAARLGHWSDRDVNKLLRRLLLRVVDRLEHDD